MLLLIDNYDSFSYNLVQMAGSICPDIKVIRNDEYTVAEAANMNPSHIILSPGPGYPKDAGICKEVVQVLGSRIPVLGVCLGHQAICEAFGSQIVHAQLLMHGKSSQIKINIKSPLFQGMNPDMKAARYHSLAVKRETIPSVLEITAEDERGEVMAVQHKEYPIYGVQFHPESILTPYGRQVINNFLKIKPAINKM